MDEKRRKEVMMERKSKGKSSVVYILNIAYNLCVENGSNGITDKELFDKVKETGVLDKRYTSITWKEFALALKRDKRFKFVGFVKDRNVSPNYFLSTHYRSKYTIS